MRRELLLALGMAALMAFPVYAGETEESAPVGANAETAALQETEEEVSSEMSEETIGKILDALENDAYRSVRRILKEGTVIGKGYRGDAGAGLQRMLADFGCGIRIDGAVGAKTMEALHQVQDCFGLQETEEVDLSLFDTLLPLLLLSKGEEGTDVDLHGFYEEAGGEGFYEYLKGCALSAQGRYYSAQKAFGNSSYGDSGERAASCLQELPENGELWHSPDIAGTDSSLTITVNSADESKGMCFSMYGEGNQLVSVLFVKGSGSATVFVPVGTYRIKDGTGYEWYGVRDTFGPYAYYEYLTFSEDPDTRYDAVLDYGEYELKINVEQIEEGATSVGSTSAGWKDEEAR